MQFVYVDSAPGYLQNKKKNEIPGKRFYTHFLKTQ